MSQDLKVITVRIPDRLTREAKADAALAGEPLQEWYRKAIEDRLRKREVRPTE